MLLVVTYTNTDTGAEFHLSTLMGNPYAQSAMIAGSAGGPCRKTFRGRHKVADIIGSRRVETDDSFASLTSAKPNNLVWLALGADGIGNNLTNGVTYLIKIRMHIRFYERKYLAV